MNGMIIETEKLHHSIQAEKSTDVVKHMGSPQGESKVPLKEKIFPLLRTRNFIL